MKANDLLYEIDPPCAKCPYKLGLVYAVRNPCPECKMNHYQFYDWFKNRMEGRNKT